MANPAPAPTPGTADPYVQSSISVGGRRAKADVAMVSLATGSQASDPVASIMLAGLLAHAGKQVSDRFAGVCDQAYEPVRHFFDTVIPQKLQCPFVGTEHTWSVTSSMAK